MNFRDSLPSRKKAHAPAAINPGANGNEPSGPDGKKNGQANQVITHACGHKTGVHHLEGSLCLACFLAKKRGRANGGGRLPDGATVHVRYDAGQQLWSGTLKVGDLEFVGSKSGLFALLRGFDAMYRQQAQD
jgi:hypothetical protein